jgi:uncharacterized protein (DUF58 family)
MFKLTKSGWCFLGLMFLLYLSSMQSQSGLLFFIIGIIFACFVLNYFMAFRSLRFIEFQLPEKINMVEGKYSTIAMEVHNKSFQTQGMVEINASCGVLFRIGAVGGGVSAHFFPEITFPVRGIYELSGLRKISSFPFGLLKVGKPLKQRGKVVVVPAVYECTPPPADGFEPMTGGSFTGKHKSSSGNEFAGVREFTPDDPLKFIHWKSSAKGRGLMVKEFNEELSGRITIILDCTPSAAENGETRLDRAVRAVGSVTLAALDIGHHVDIIVMSDMNILKFPPFADGTALLDMLAGVKTERDCITEQTLQKAVDSAARRSAICFVMTEPSESLDRVIEQLINERRKVSVYMPYEVVNDIKPYDDVKVFSYEKRV